MDLDSVMVYELTKKGAWPISSHLDFTLGQYPICNWTEWRNMAILWSLDQVKYNSGNNRASNLILMVKQRINSEV